MNINKTLLNETNTYLHNYNCIEYDIEQFLIHSKTFDERQENAIDIIEDIMETHGKEILLKYVVELAKVEVGIRELEPWVRDHVTHALLSFILGIYLNEQFLKPLSGVYVDDFQWKLAGLFHDVGYPSQIAKDILTPYTEKINEIKTELDIPSEDIIFKVVPEGLENLTNNVNSFDLIQNRIDEWELEIDVEKEYHQMIGSGNVCHGIISSLSILYVIDLMYQKYNPERKYKDIYRSDKTNWNQKCFERDVISACSAIYIHNLPKRCFERAKIDRLKAPVAFLLRLSDCLQDWERPSKNSNGYSASKFDVKIANNLLILQTNIPNTRKKDIKDEISSSLIAPDVRIC